MRVRTVLLAFGLLELLVPNRIVAWGERLAFENPGEGRLRPWTLPMARLEGLVFVWLVLRGRASISPGVRRLLVAIGLPAALAPRTFLAGSLAIAYENPGDVRTKPWVVPFTRLLGAAYLVTALMAGRVGTPGRTDEREATAGAEPTNGDG